MSSHKATPVGGPLLTRTTGTLLVIFLVALALMVCEHLGVERGQAGGELAFPLVELQAEPAPGFHDLFALRRYRRLRIEGDIRLLSAYLFYIKRLFELMRPGPQP